MDRKLTHKNLGLGKQHDIGLNRSLRVVEPIMGFEMFFRMEKIDFFEDLMK